MAHSDELADFAKEGILPLGGLCHRTQSNIDHHPNHQILCNHGRDDHRSCHQSQKHLNDNASKPNAESANAKGNTALSVVMLKDNLSRKTADDLANRSFSPPHFAYFGQWPSTRNGNHSQNHKGVWSPQKRQPQRYGNILTRTLHREHKPSHLFG